LDSPSLCKFYVWLWSAPRLPDRRPLGARVPSGIGGQSYGTKPNPHREARAEPRCRKPRKAQPIEPILFPKLRIRLAEFPYTTLFYRPETAHLGDLMRIRYGRLRLMID